MDRASHRIGGMAGLLAVVGAGTWWWHVSAAHPDRAAAPSVVVVHGDAPPPVVAQSPSAPLPAPTMAAADPVVAARRDTTVLKAVAPVRDTDSVVLDGAMTRQDRDPAEARPVEDAMTAAVRRLPALTQGRVLCVSTTCEVTGTAPSERSVEEVERALRDPALLRAMVERGYMPGPATVARTAQGTLSYVLYLNNEM